MTADRTPLAWLGALLLALLPAALLAGCGGVAPIQDPFNKAVYHYSKGNLDEAIAEYRLALEDEPEDAQAAFNLAVTLEERADQTARAGRKEAASLRLSGKAEEAAATAEIARAKEAALRAEARTWYEATEKLEARSRGAALRAGLNLAAIDYERGEKTAALERVRALVDRHPRSTLPRASLAAFLIREGRLDEAKPVLEAAHELDPASIEINTLLADVWIKTGDRDKARDAYTKALKRDADDLGAVLGLARLEYEDGHKVVARGLYQRVLYIRPSHLEAHVRLAELLEAEGDLKGAIEHLWDARSLDDGQSHAVPSPDYSKRLAELMRRLAEAEERASAS